MKLNEFAKAVMSIGATNTILAQGEPGIGKSSILKVLTKQLPSHEVSYIDCAQLDLGDFALPYVEAHDVNTKVTHFAPSARFKAHLGRPVCVMLDELGKAQRPVQNVLLTLLMERRIGDMYLPEGSIVFATTNLASDGVGDKIEAHARNRMTIIQIEKPTSTEWVEWALHNNVDPIVIAFTSAFPQVLASYTTNDADNNPYIFNPKKPKVSFVTPRSLEAASNIVKNRAFLGASTTHELLSGAIGASAAADMATFVSFGDQKPSWGAIIASPSSTPVPESAVVRSMVIHSAIQHIVQGEKGGEAQMNQWLKYLQRLDVELQALFCITILRKYIALPWVGQNRALIELVTKMAWVVS